MIKTEITPQRKTVQISQESQNNRLLTDKSRSLKKLHKLPSSVELYQITPTSRGTAPVTSASNPIFVQPKILHCQRQAELSAVQSTPEKLC